MKDIVETDRAEILALIEAETAAWLRGDIEAWTDCWLDSGEAVRASARVGSGVEVIRGRDAQRARVAVWMARLPQDGLRPEEVRRENLQVRVSGDMAWVHFDQITPTGTDRCPSLQHHTRVLERHAGRWWIAYVSQMVTRLGTHACPWARLGPGGRILGMDPAAEVLLAGHRALKVVGGRLCGRTRGDQATLRRALDFAQDPGAFPANSGTWPVLFSHAADGVLSLCWITTRDAMLVMLFDDEAGLERKLARARDVYGLSPAQVRVARAIAQGQDSRAAAQALSVQPSTVRTQLRRMFDKLGVSSQPALIGKLLSVEAPGD